VVGWLVGWLVASAHVLGCPLFDFLHPSKTQMLI